MTHRVAPPRTPPRCKLQRAVLLQDFPGHVLLHVANLAELRIFERGAQPTSDQDQFTALTVMIFRSSSCYHGEATRPDKTTAWE
eukprot:CAMPEP_0177175572 /NCGR_PEP_ID=MMETSP0367-20130122/12782_1 /TAXON_ID=447022 ORGANISM="Scrippsiella hangoei-like, Strain SHHI-4" /NCGR_SAMPLE_ID=MMETSP0367 /ASSEMBLY_ACC=CAM_ASM_000362 /LENGTH=83 /DNA_ID=CAMNT_0018622003 /DNA_START=145 /DNA_END=396 /DNA_ORIENTATION=+